MRIFIAVRHSINPTFYYGGLWSSNFYSALKELGHELVESQVDLLPASHFMAIPNNFTAEELEVRNQITEQIIAEVKQAHQKKPIDLFLSYFYNSHFNPDRFGEIHNSGIPTVNFYCNSIYQFELVSEIAKKVNFAWHAEKEARNSYLQIGANPVWVQMGANPKVYYPTSNKNKEKKACFVGQRYADRDRYLAELVKNNLPLDIYGNGWNLQKSKNSSPKIENYDATTYLGRSIKKPASLSSYTQAVWQNFHNQNTISGLCRTINQLNYRFQSRKLSPLLATYTQGFANSIRETFSQYEVILNFSNVWADGRPGSKLIPHVRLRDFEAPMSRTCYLTGYTEEIAEFYDLGTEIDTYKSVDELVDKTRFYLNHPQTAEKLREAGYQRALRDHTWTSRFKQLFREIQLVS